MIGVGLVLPMIGFSAHAGTLSGLPWALMPLMLVLSLSCAMATALPDEPSDRADGKRTHAVRFGVAATQRNHPATERPGSGLARACAASGHDAESRVLLALALRRILWLVSLRLSGARPGERGMLHFVAPRWPFALRP
jgi:1,4-dihydroxy-2-naphthoate polyprenyltransferase